MMKRLSAMFCVGLVVMFMITIFTRFFNQNVLIEKLHMDNRFTRAILFDKLQQPDAVNIHWAQLYPFTNANTGGTTTGERLNNRVAMIEKKINEYTAEGLAGYMWFTETAMHIEDMLDWELHEVVVDMGGGYLVEPLGKEDITPSVRALVEFDQFLKDRDIDLLYVQCPNKISRDDSLPGIANFFNQNADNRLSALSSYQVPWLDLRDAVHAESLDHHDLFFRTDHHWKPETGLWATGKLAEYLNTHNDFSIDLSLFNPERYRRDVYEDWFLGSYGRRLTLIRAAPEDISLLYPQFDTDVSMQIPSRALDIRGTFEIFYDYRHIEKIDYYKRSPYAAYLYGDNPVTTIHNNIAERKNKVLFIGDSFSLAFVPFFACSIENTELLNLVHFTGGVRSYIVQTSLT
jgi:hypothetical protein